MAFTVRIPQSYATRIINAIRNSSNIPRIQDAKIRGLNVQPDGSLLVRSESAESPYEAYVDIFNQNLGIPFAAIRGFETLADTATDANQYRTGIATTPEKKAAIDASGLYADSRAIAPEDITTPFTGAGDVQDLTFDERRAIGEMPFGPYQITPPRTILPYVSEGQGEGSIAGGLFRDPEDAEVPKVAETGDAIPANLPEFWRERYDEYLLLSPYLQSVILENQIKNYIELEPYRGEGIDGAASIDGLFTNEPGSIADIALESVFDPSKGGVGGTNFEVQPPAGYVPTSRIPDPLQLQGYANTGLQDILNIFYANPDQYISEIPVFEDVFNEAGQVIGQRQVGTQQALSPVAQAALQAFSTQRGAESADIASRFGTATPFGAIAGLGGSAGQALGLAELQARAGVTNPYAALGTGSAIGDIGTILRGGLTPEEQLALEGLQARGGLTAEQRLAELGTQYNPFSETAQNRLDLARAQASGGLTNELNILAAQQAAAANNPFAAAQLGIDIGNISTILRGGLTPNQQLALAQAPGNPFGLTAQQQIDLQNQLARGGLTAQEQSALVGLQARGGLTVQEQLNLAGLQARGGLTAQERLAEQRLAALSPLLQASPGTLGGLSRVLGGEAQLQGLFSPFTSDTSATGMANVMQQTSPTPFTTQSMERPRQTIGGYQRADLFDRGAIEAEAGMAGEELDRYLGQVSLGAGSPRVSLGAQLA